MRRWNDFVNNNNVLDNYTNYLVSNSGNSLCYECQCNSLRDTTQKTNLKKFVCQIVSTGNRTRHRSYSASTPTVCANHWATELVVNIFNAFIFFHFWLQNFSINFLRFVCSGLNCKIVWFWYKYARKFRSENRCQGNWHIYCTKIER